MLKEKNILYCGSKAHELRQNEGLQFINCRLISNAAQNSVFLARPWRDYGIVVFDNCYMENHIKSEGFDKWNDTNRDKTCRFSETGSYGPGANNTSRVSWRRNENKAIT